MITYSTIMHALLLAGLLATAPTFPQQTGDKPTAPDPSKPMPSLQPQDK